MSDFRSKKRIGSGQKSRTNSRENLHKLQKSPSSSTSSLSSITGGTNNSRNRNGTKSSRQTNDDVVRSIVKEEGRTARNLIAYSVPLQEESDKVGKTMKLSASPRKSSQPNLRTRSADPSTRFGRQRKRSGRDETPPSKKNESASRRSSGSGIGKKPDLRARYWAFLFDNLQRAVDEIYKTCEADESELECREVIMMLERCTHDFKTLIERFRVIKEFENADDGKRPTSLAWELRKTSPGKSLVAANASQSSLIDKQPSSAAQRALKFTSFEERPTDDIPAVPVQRSPNVVSGGNSWADRVKGISTTPPLKKQPNSGDTENVPAINDGPVDMDGWETVHNHKKDKTKSRNSPGQKIGPSRLKNSRVTPNKQNAAKANQLHPNGVRTSGGLNRKKSPSDSNLHNKTIGSSQSKKSSTKTTDDREPERPVKSERCIVTALEQERLDNNNDIDSTVISVDAASEQTAEPQSEKRNAWVASGRQHSDPGAAPAVQNGGDVFAQTVADEDIDLQIRTLRTLSEPGFNGHCDDLEENGLAYTANNGAEIAGNSTVDDDQTKDEGMGKKLKVIDDDEEEEDEDNRLEEEQEQAIQSAIKEEESYLKEIEEEENNVIAASIVDDEPENDGSDPLDWEGILAEDEARRNSHEILTWGDQVESEMDDSRTPGRCVHMHEKLSSPSRKRSIRESQKRHEEKQAKAEELREKQQRDKSERLKYLSNKVEEVRAHKLGLMQVKRETMEQKLARADSIRRIQIKNKVKKAHEEETKANEIAFINSLEALNKKHDIMSKHQESEARLHDIQEERQRKHEEKAAMEAKAAERRRNIEAERMNRIQEIQEKRKQREQVVEQRQQEKEKERLESAKAKEKDREQRIAALNAQQQAHIEELKHKIKHKQEESTRRHQEKLDEIREKAFEMSLLRHSTEDHNEAPKLTPYDKKKLCHVCNVLLPSEVHLLSHLRGRQHQQSIQDGNSGKDLSKQDIESFNLKNITNAPLDRPDPKAVSDRERQKAQKKRSKKLRQRMTQRGQEYEKSLDVKLQVPDSEHKAKIQKVLKDLCKYVQQQSSGPWPQNRVSALDRALGEISRILEKKVAVDQNTFRICGGIPIVCNILSVIENSSLTLPPVIPNKSLILACNVLRFACKGSYENCHYMLFSNKIALITDLLAHRLEILIPDDFNSLLESSLNSLSSLMIKLPDDSVSTGLMQVISTSLSCLAKKNPTATSSEASAERMTVSADAFINRSNDIISYLISVGVVDKLHQYFSGVREPIDDDIPASDFLTHSLALLCSMIRVNTKKSSNVFEKNCKIQDPTQLISTFSATELFGIVSLLYGMLLHGDAPSRRDTESPPELPLHTLNVTVSAIKMLNSMAALDLNTFQKSLGEEGTWLEYRHICSYLLWYCSHYPSNDDLQHEIILCVGYFTALNQDNQLFIQSGQPPTVLQQLCSLPFQYFSDPKLMNILYPTLIACCYDNSANRAILEHELSCELLANFLEEKDLECQQAKLTPSTNGKKTKSQEMKEWESRMSLVARFPQDYWNKVQLYFREK